MELEYSYQKLAGHYFHSALIQGTIFVGPTGYGGMAQKNHFWAIQIIDNYTHST